LDRLDGVIEGEDAIFEVVPLDMAVARYIHLVPREIVPDMPDRIIAATALYLEVPLVSRDRRIHLSNLEVIW
jgi:predicted nucleic acid-binding protein